MSQNTCGDSEDNQLESVPSYHAVLWMKLRLSSLTARTFTY